MQQNGKSSSLKTLEDGQVFLYSVSLFAQVIILFACNLDLQIKYIDVFVRFSALFSLDSIAFSFHFCRIQSMLGNLKSPIHGWFSTRR